MAPGEFERSDSAVQVRVLWGDTVLRVEHLDPSRSFRAGDTPDADLVPDRETLGSASLPLVSPENGRVTVLVPGGQRRVLEQVGSKVTVTLTSRRTGQAYRGQGDVDWSSVPVAVEVSLVWAGRAVGRWPPLRDGARLISPVAFAGAVVAGLLVFGSSRQPEEDDFEGLTRDQILLSQRLLEASNEREEPSDEEMAASGEWVEGRLPPNVRTARRYDPRHLPWDDIGWDEWRDPRYPCGMGERRLAIRDATLIEYTARCPFFAGWYGRLPDPDPLEPVALPSSLPDVPMRIVHHVSTVDGAQSPEAIGRVVRQSTGRFRACYLAALGDIRAFRPHAKAARADVHVHFGIDGDGDVTYARADGELPNYVVGPCLARTFEELVFPPGVATVEYSIKLLPDQPAPTPTP
jgi:hypothetical protein